MFLDYGRKLEGHWLWVVSANHYTDVLSQQLLLALIFVLITHAVFVGFCWAISLWHIPAWTLRTNSQRKSLVS